MSEVHISVTLEFEDIEKGFRAMQARAIDPRNLFKRQRPLLKDDQKEHFENLEGTTSQWPPRASSSIRRARGNKKKSFTKRGRLRKAAKRRLRNQLGRLKTFWKFRVTPQFLEIASGAQWAGIHQAGGVAGHGSRIPQREFVWISDDILRQFQDDYLNELIKAWEGS